MCLKQFTKTFPFSGPAFEPYKLMRQARPDIFRGTTGILTEDGEKWHEMRSKVQKDLMRVKSALFYIDALQEVGDDFVDFIRQKRNKNDNVIQNCMPEFFKYTYESIALVAMETRLGCLKMPMDSELQKVFDASKIVFDSFGGLLKNPSWQFLPPRWNKTYREAEDAFQIVFDFSKTHLEANKAKFASMKDKSSDDMSVLQRMLKTCGSDSNYPLVMAIDLLIAGIDTTGTSLGFLLYCLAMNPDKQDILRKECQNLGPNLSVNDLNQLKYLKACMLEANRLTPTLNIFLRTMPKDIVLRDYNIPKGTQITWSPFIFQEQFPDHEKFLPERWLENKKEICPFAVRQFSHGPRMCIGKRFAELELLTVTNKLMNNFNIKCTNAEPMTISQVLVNEPDQPLDFQFNDL